MSKKVVLSTKKELRIFLDPLRQDIMQKMSIWQEPVTAKKLADEMKITPSSAKHHLEKLRSIGIVEIDHLEKIHGIIATFYKIEAADVTLAEQGTMTESQSQMIVKNLIDKMFYECCKRINYYKKKTEQEDNTNKHFRAQMINSTIFLSHKEADEVQKLVEKYIHNHDTKKEGTIPFSLNLIAYDAREIEE